MSVFALGFLALSSAVLAQNAPPPPQAAPRKATLGEKAAAKGTKPPPTQIAPRTTVGGRELVKIPLTHVGVFDSRYLNARNPPKVIGDSATAASVDLGFQNLTGTQTLLVSFSVFVPRDMQQNNSATTLTALRNELQRRVDAAATSRVANGGAVGSPIRIGDCKAKGNDVVCDATVRIDPNGMGVVAVTLLAHVVEPRTTTPISFKVDFFAENATPARPTGYFSVVDAKDLQEIDSEVGWAVTASVGYEHAPDIDKDAILSPANPYEMQTTQDFPAKGLLTLESNLGGRATASVDLSFKTDALDGTDDGAVSSPRFQIDIHAIKPVTLSFGHYEFASPSSGLSVNEKGEGWQLAVRNYSFAAIINPDSGERLPTGDTRHDKEVLIQAVNLSSTNLKHLESLSLYGVFGRVSYDVAAADAAPATLSPAVDISKPVLPHGQAHQYGSVGAETFLTFKRDLIRTGLSAYFNSASDTHDSQFDGQHGYTLDATGTFTKFGPAGSDQLSTVKYFISTEAALGYRNAGEHQAFAPDTLFLSTFAPKIDASSGLGAGMADKAYFSAGLTVKHDSPLYWFARMIGVPDSDIASNASIITWHYFNSIRGPYKGTLSNEYDAEFDVETPAKVTSSVTLSYFRPEGVLKTTLGGRSGFCALAAAIKVKI